MTRRLVSKAPRTKTTLTDTQLAVRAVLRRGEKSRKNLTEFYRMVIRHEITKEKLEPAPHQQLMFSFIEAHERCVFRQPIGTGKTFGMAAVTLWLMGNDVTQRGAIVSKTMNQASKVLTMVGDYITEPSLSASLTVAFPWLQKSPRSSEPWTMTKLTVKRPPAIRDATLIAAGLETSIGGARLSWLVADDVLDISNSCTPDQQEKTRINLEGRILSRLDPVGSRAVFTNTPWDRQDCTYYLEEQAGWPTITMDIYGNIRITNAKASWLAKAHREFIRHSNHRPDSYRLIAHDPDPDETIALWPERINMQRIEEIRKSTLPHEFARLYLCEPIDAEAARCQKDWIEKCKLRGIGTSMLAQYDGPNHTFTGVDLGIGDKGKHDLTVLFTFELLPDGSRRVLDIQSGRFAGAKIVELILAKTRAYHSTPIVENNGAQRYIQDFAKKERADIIVRAHTTTRVNKQSLDFGVESIFTELQQGAWIIPCDENGTCHPEINKWIDGMLYYMPPPHHTSDHLMACWIGRERARRHGHNDPIPKRGKMSRWATQQRQHGASGF